ncbi:MAG: hypothetical protein ACREYE_28290 [Gammaproteobacteria bacterium]
MTTKAPLGAATAPQKAIAPLGATVAPPQGGAAITRARGRFVKGTPSPNPGGMPKFGDRKSAAAIRRAFIDLADDKIARSVVAVVKMVIDKAIKDKDLVAAKIILDRVLPAHKATDPSLVKGFGGIQIVVSGTTTDVSLSEKTTYEHEDN